MHSATHRRLFVRTMLSISVWTFASCQQSTGQQKKIVETRPPMAGFVQALQKQDRNAFLTFFSKTSEWNYISTISAPPASEKIAYQTLKSDFEKRKGWYEVLFDAGGDDCFRDWVLDADLSAWVEKRPNRFVRQQADGKDSVYVEWKKEGNVWVVAAIAEPSA